MLFVLLACLIFVHVVLLLRVVAILAYVTFRLHCRVWTMDYGHSEL
jgi:hypothetical protein